MLKTVTWWILQNVLRKRQCTQCRRWLSAKQFESSRFQEKPPGRCLECHCDNVWWDCYLDTDS